MTATPGMDLLTELCQDGSEHNIPFPSWSWSAWNCFAHPPFSVCINRGPSETEPLIIFYRSSIEGKIVKINEFWNKSYGTGPPDAEALDCHDNNGLINQWIGKPRYDKRAVRPVPGIEFIDSGLLHFWTSTASLRLAPESYPMVIHTGPFPLRSFRRQW